jgi:hypothetical protein
MKQSYDSIIKPNDVAVATFQDRRELMDINRRMFHEVTAVDAQIMMKLYGLERLLVNRADNKREAKVFSTWSSLLTDGNGFDRVTIRNHVVEALAYD